MKGPFVEEVSIESQNNTKQLSAQKAVIPLASHNLYIWWFRVPAAQCVLTRKEILEFTSIQKKGT